MSAAQLLVVGIGGQGVMTAADLLARAALAAGLDASKTEVAGMSQRGGVVSSQVRVGARVLACEIEPGDVDLLLALEAAEALRWSHWLSPGGRAFVNTLRAVPPIVNSGLAHYPEDPIGTLRALVPATCVLEASATAAALGDPRLTNTVMLGAAADALPFAAEVLLAQILERFARSERLRALNCEAFEAGRERARRTAVP